MSGNRADRRASGDLGRAAPDRLGDRYGSRAQRRALAPAALAVIALLAGLALLDTGGYIVIRYAVSILALITAVFVYQAKQWAWLPVPVVVAVLWNPVVPFPFSGAPWQLGQFVACVALLVVGAFVKYTDPDSHAG